MTLINIINEKLAQNNPDTVLKKMGYRNPDHARERLESLTKAPSIESWLRHSSYDLHYSGKEFLRKLFEVLSLPADALEEELKLFDDKTVALAKMQQPYIYIDTNFKRQSQPIFALAMMEGRRRIPIDKEKSYGRELDKVLKRVGEIIVCRHYRESGGELPMCGRIRRYVYPHSGGRSSVFDTERKLVSENNEIEESRVQMSLYGRALDLIFNGELKDWDIKMTIGCHSDMLNYSKVQKICGHFCSSIYSMEG